MRKKGKFFAVLVCALALCLCGIAVCMSGCNETPTSVTVTFMVDDEAYDRITVAPGKTIERPDSPANKEGYSFKGWYLDPNDTDSGAFDFEETPITSDLTLYALYQVKTYQVVFSAPDGTVLEGFPSGTYDWGSLIPEPDVSAIAKDGYMVRWLTKDNKTWDFATDRVKSKTELVYRYVSGKDSYVGKEVYENFYPVYNKTLTGTDQEGKLYCDTVYTDGAETVSYTYQGDNLQQIVINLEIATLDYASVTVVARPADQDGVYANTGTFSQLRAYILTDAGGNISFNDKATSGYEPADYYIQSTGVNKELCSVKADAETGWQTITFDLASLKFWNDGSTLHSFAFGFVATTFGIEVQSVVFNAVDKTQEYSVQFVDGAGNPIEGVAEQRVLWNSLAEKPEKPADTEYRKYTGEWLTANGEPFDFTTRIRTNVVLTAEYSIEGLSSWTGSDLLQDTYAVYNNSRNNPAGKVANGENTVFTFNGGSAGNGLEQIVLGNLNLAKGDLRYFTIKIKMLNYSDLTFNETDALGRVRIYVVTDLGGDLVNKDKSDASKYYYELTGINYTAVTAPVDVSAKFEDGFYVVTVDLSSLEYFAQATVIKGIAFGTTTAVKALEVEEIAFLETIEEKAAFTVSFADENGDAIDGIDAQTVPYGKVAVAPSADQIPAKEGLVFDRWVDADGNAFSFSYAVTESVTLKPVYVDETWEGETISYTKQEIADRFTASRERYGNTLATAPNIQYDIKTDETSGEAVFEYATDMKAANKCITGLDLGMNLHEGSKLTLRFYSEAFAAGTHVPVEFKIGLCFRGEDPATTIKNGAANAHYFTYNIVTGAMTNYSDVSAISVTVDGGTVVVTFDLWSLAQASAAKFSDGVNGRYLEGFTFLMTEAAKGTTAATQNADTITFYEVKFESVRQKQQTEED